MNADKPTKALFDALEAEITQANADADAEREAYVQRLRAHQDRATAAEKRIRAAIALVTETHQWTQGRGKLGVGKGRITTSVNLFGWRHAFSSRPGWEICSLIVDATVGCRSQATWQVERWRDNRTSSATTATSTSGRKTSPSCTAVTATASAQLTPRWTTSRDLSSLRRRPNPLCGMAADAGRPMTQSDHDPAPGTYNVA